VFLTISPTYFYARILDMRCVASSSAGCDIFVTSFFENPVDKGAEIRSHFSFFPYLIVAIFALYLKNSYVIRKRNSVNDSKITTPNDREIERISKLIDCPIEIVRHCMMQIGPSVPAIDAYWQMNKDRLMVQCCKKTMEEVKNESKYNARLPIFSL
jgi:hypothetical protein